MADDFFSGRRLGGKQSEHCYKMIILDLILFFTFALWPYTLAVYYSLLVLQAFLILRPILDQAPSALVSFAAQCLMPLFGFPIFWICYYWWQPYPNPADWSSDPNGCIAFCLTIALAIALSVLTTKLATKPKSPA